MVHSPSSSDSFNLEESLGDKRRRENQAEISAIRNSPVSRNTAQLTPEPSENTAYPTPEVLRRIEQGYTISSPPTPTGSRGQQQSMKRCRTQNEFERENRPSHIAQNSNLGHRRLAHMRSIVWAVLLSSFCPSVLYLRSCKQSGFASIETSYASNTGGIKEKRRKAVRFLLEKLTARARTFCFLLFARSVT